MYQIIAPTLFQNKICRLPGLGTLVMVPHLAETDFVNSRIKSPTESIGFIAEESNEKVFNEFSAISELLQKNLDENGSFLLKGIGTFTKSSTGEVSFAPIGEDPMFVFSVAAERINRQATAHAMLVGDEETTNTEMAEFYKKGRPVRDWWWVWAAALALIGIGVLIYYLKQNGVNGFGNLAR